jgi:glycosyltransferase involved in cell wall biosynthesis
MNPKRQDLVRILHVVGGMERGGVETWLMHVLHNVDRERFQLDFLVHTTNSCAYDEEIRALGSEIIPCLSPSWPWQYAINFQRIIKEYGPYDVVHSHVHHFSGFVLFLARRAGVPVRITHSHSDTSLNDNGAGMVRKGYLRIMEHLIKREATSGLACSRQAAVALYGEDWQKNRRWQVLYCGIELEPFRQPVDCDEVRREFGIPMDAFVLGHVGGFREPKNHTFLIDIAAEVAKHDPCMRLLLVGDGPLRFEIENKVAILRLTDKVIFVGSHPDVPRIMKGAMNVFVMPSLHEGLPVAGIEAQAAGLPLVISDTITDELNVTGSQVSRVSLASSLDVWCRTITEFKNNLLIRDSESIIENSIFNINKSIQLLYRHWLNGQKI